MELPDEATGVVTVPRGLGVFDDTAGSKTWTWNADVSQFADYRRAAGLPEAVTLIVDGVAAGAEATATISYDNVNHPYTVVIDGVTHTGTVYDHFDGNNTATLTARPGTYGLGPDKPAAGSLSPRSVSAVVVEWQPVPAVNDRPVSHYEVQRSSSDWGEPPDKVACPRRRHLPVCGHHRPDRADVPLPGAGGEQPGRAGVVVFGYADRCRGMRWAPRRRRCWPPRPNEPDGGEQILLAWTKPVENGSSIVSYTIEVASGGNGPWAELTDAGPAADNWGRTPPSGPTRV